MYNHRGRSTKTSTTIYNHAQPNTSHAHTYSHLQTNAINHRQPQTTTDTHTFTNKHRQLQAKAHTYTKHKHTQQHRQAHTNKTQSQANNLEDMSACVTKQTYTHAYERVQTRTHKHIRTHANNYSQCKQLRTLANTQEQRHSQLIAKRENTCKHMHATHTQVHTYTNKYAHTAT